MDIQLKRILSFVLAVVMVIGMMPTNIVFANDDVDTPTTAATEATTTEATTEATSVETTESDDGDTDGDDVPEQEAEESEDPIEPEESSEDVPEESSEDVPEASSEDVPEESSEDVPDEEPSEEVPEEPAEDAEVVRVQAMIDALRTTINEGEEAEAKAEYDAATAAISALTDEQRAQLDFTNYYAAAVPTVIPVEDNVIDSLEELQAFVTEVNAGNTYENETVTLNADITLSGEWTPIGNGTRSSKSYSGNAFKGTFDGGNHTISGLTISSTTDADAAIGLFGVLDGGTVKNLKLTGVNINVANSDLAGGAIGMMLNGATAENITVSGSVTGYDGVGGIVGRLIISGTISKCTNNADVTSSYGGIGGIVGKAYYEDGSDTTKFATITGCVNNGTITASMYVGGIVGLARANVTNCTNNGAVVGGTQTGGIVGQLIAAGNVSGNVNKAKISGKNHMGGIIGDYTQSGAYTYNNVTINNNTNYGELAASEQCAAIMGCNNIDGFTNITASGNMSYYTADGLELFGNPEDMVIDDSNKFYVPPVAKVGDVEYTDFAEALTAAKAMTGDVTVEIYDKVTLNTSLSGSYDSITFVGKDTDAEIYLDVQGYITASGKKVAFEALTLSKSEGGFITNAGFMNVAFGVYDVAEVTYTNCTFANGAYASSGKVTFDDCTFYRSYEKYGLWAYGDADITVTGCEFAIDRGIKMYAENQQKVTNLTVENTDFSKVTAKPAIVLTYGESVTLKGNTYSETGTFELDLDGAPDGVAVTSDVAPVCVNDNGACGVLVDGKIYTNVETAAAAVSEAANVTVLYSTDEAWTLPAGSTVTLATGVTAANVIVTPTVATIGEKAYASLSEAVAAAASGSTILLMDGNHTMPIGSDVNLQGKTLTIKGSRDAIIDATKVDERDQYVIGATLTFDGVTVNFGTANYMGFANYAALTYKNCAVNGLQFAYGSGATVFENCDLNSNGAEHSLWTWGGQNISFTDCNFTYGDRAVNCYGEGVTTNISFTDCTFTKVEGKECTGAIEINSSALTGMNVVIDNCTVNEGKLWWISQWDSKQGQNTVVTQNGVVVWKVFTGSITPGYTSADGKIWGEAKGNARESFVIKVLDAEGNAMGTTTLNNVGGIIDGNIENVTWSLKLDAESNTDSYWTMEWTTKPTIDNMPASVALYVDGEQVATNNVQLNGADNINKINAITTDANGNITGYYLTFADAVAAAEAGATIEMLADIEASEVILIDKSLTINGNGHKITSSANRVIRVTTSNVEVTLNDVNMVSSAVRVGTNDIRGISIDGPNTNVELTLKNCSVDFTDASANDWAYAVNVSGGCTGIELNVTGGTYEGANVINVYETSAAAVTVTGATLNCLYPANDQYYGYCITAKNEASAVTATGNTFNGSNAVAIGADTVTESDNTDNTTKIVAKVGENLYTTLKAAIKAASAGDTVTLLHNVTEDVTVSKNLTIDGNGKSYTGNIAATGTNSTIEVTVKNVNFVDGTGYAITTNRIKSITVENCTVKNYGYGFLYANRSTPTVNVKNVTVENVNYGMHWVYGSNATLENVKMTNVTYGLMLQNYGAKTVTLKNCEISGTNALNVWEREGYSAVQTFKFEGANTVTGDFSDVAKLVLAEEDATLTAAEGENVTPGVEGMVVVYRDGVYKLIVPVAKIGEEYYESLQAAIDAANDGDIIELVWAEGDAPINMNGAVYGKTVTVTGTAQVNWHAGWLYVGRGGEGDGKLIFSNAQLTAAANKGRDIGIHVSGATAESTKNDGTLVITDGSNIELDWLVNRNEVIVEGNSTLTTVAGCITHGRNAAEAEGGEAQTATLTVEVGSTLVQKSYTVTVGNESYGVLNIKGTLNAPGLETKENGTVNVEGGSLNVSNKLTNNGTVNITDSNVKLNKLDNDNLMFLTGTNTFQVEDATGSSYAIRANDGVVMNNSYYKGTANETFRLLGSATFNGGFECAYLQGSSAGVGGYVFIEEDTTVKATYGVEFSKDYVLDGGTIELSGGNANGKFWGCVFQSGTYQINTDIVVAGTGVNGAYLSVHFTNATAEIYSDISHSNSCGEPIYITNSNVTVFGGSLNSTTGVHVNTGAELNLVDATVDANVTVATIVNMNYNSRINGKVSGTGKVIVNTDDMWEMDDVQVIYGDCTGATIEATSAAVRKDAEGAWAYFEAMVSGEETWKGYASLAEAVAAAKDGEMVILTRDVTLDEAIVVEGKSISISRFDECTITSTANDVFTVVNGELTLNWLTINGSSSILYAQASGVINVNGGELNGKKYTTAFAEGEGAVINLNDVTVTNDSCSAICAKQSGVINVAGYSTIKTTAAGTSPKFCAAYAGSNGVINILDGDVEADVGYSVVAVADGAVNISGGNIKNGVLSHENANALVNISGGQIFGGVATEEGASIYISGGWFEQSPLNITGVTLAKDMTWTEDNKQIHHASYVAFIDTDEDGELDKNEVGYTSVAAAIAAAEEGETIALLNNVMEAVEIDKSITLDVNGYVLSGVGEETEAALITIKSGDVTITDSSTDNTGAVVQNEKGHAVLVSADGSLTLNAHVQGFYAGIKTLGGDVTIEQNGSVHATSTTTACGDGIRAYGDAVVTVNGGSVSSCGSNQGYGIELYQNATAVINSAYVSGKSAICVYGGTLVVNDGQICGGTEYAIVTSSNGPASVIGAADVTINGGLIEGQVVIEKGTYPASVKITDGSFNKTGDEETLLVVEEGADGSVTVSGGYFATGIDESFLAPGYKLETNDDGSCHVAEARVIAFKDHWSGVENADSVYVDGVHIGYFNIVNGDIEIAGKMAEKKYLFITAYTYLSGDAGAFPDSMKVWLATGTDADGDGSYDSYTVAYRADLENFFMYNGTSIRVGTAKNGIRFFSSIDPTVQNDLINGTFETLPGAKLKSAGTEFWINNVQRSYVYGGAAGKNFRVFGQTEDGRNLFTGMLVDLNADADTIATPIGTRPFAEIEFEDGSVATLYGGELYRSIYSVAQQVQNAQLFEEGTTYYNFVQGLIDKVDG